MNYPYQIKTIEQYEQVYKQSIAHPEQFWKNIAQYFTWKKAPSFTANSLNWEFQTPKVEWFKGATLNITENCLDRHLAAHGNTPALIWEPNDPEDDYRVLTYRDLYFKVCQFAHVLKNNGVQKGDRVCIYMGMVPELAIAVLACARIGAIHSVVFGGFSAQSIADRILDADARFVITQDGAYRGNKEVPLKSVIDDALVQCPNVQRVIVLTHCRMPISMIKGRDVWWENEIRKVETQGNPDFPAVEMDAEDPLFILYTSGSTGKPKGVVHSCAGYMLYTHYTFVNVFQYHHGDIHFCTADIGWITGHSYIVYGPLSAGATSLMFEGVPTWPDAGRFWNIVDKYKVNILYTAPTAIRSLMAFGDSPLEGKDLSSLKTLGTVGEPINVEAWNWYHDKIGKGKCPIVDTWWQTETGGIMISNLAGVTPHKPAHATLPLPGVHILFRDDQGNEVPYSDSAQEGLPLETVKGNLCIAAPWPSILRTTYGDHERCRTNYFATYENLYFTGDGCFRDAEGHYRITGRVDDVLNVSGHRIGTAEVENAINMYIDVVESAVVGYPHDIKGQGIYAFVILQNEFHDAALTRQDILQTVTRIIGAIAKPDKIQFVKGLNLGDTTTLLDPSVVEDIKNGAL